VNVRLSEIYQLARQFSRLSALLTIILFSILHFLSIEPSMSLQIVIATIALAIGIPHGAIDHLISVPKSSKLKFVLFILGYVAIALCAGIAISHWNKVGFQCVVLMSALHFGFGDASYSNEYKDAEGLKRNSVTFLVLYALPAGFLPVVLPLTDRRAHSALLRINPHIANWAGTFSQPLRNATLGFAIFSLAILFFTRRVQLAIDLGILALLSLVASPLITFAVYFGCWHAIRHTARLVPKLPRAMSLLENRSRGAALMAAITPGLYAVIGTLVLAGILLTTGANKESNGLLWTTLLIVWALTVPHMVATSRFDVNSLTTKS
jgi:beta-carotene 15,15'-dioxygenase